LERWFHYREYFAGRQIAGTLIDNNGTPPEPALCLADILSGKWQYFFVDYATNTLNLLHYDTEEENSTVFLVRIPLF